ncbi:MAG: hypothetical protein ACREVL_19865 [Solimonas sp.]
MSYTNEGRALLRACAILGAALLATTAQAAPGDALGPQFQVNESSLYSQDAPVVARAANGDFVVVWQLYTFGTGIESAFTLAARRYAADGTPKGGEFRVDQLPRFASPAAPAVAMRADGAFVVAWRDNASALAIFARRYGADGQPLGGAVRVNDVSARMRGVADPRVAIEADGDFSVVWREDSVGFELDLPPGCYVTCLSTDTGTAWLRRRHYGSGGTTAEPIDTVDTGSFVSTGLGGLSGGIGIGIGGFIGAYSLASVADGRSVVVWQKTQSSLIGVLPLVSSSVQLRRYEADGRARIAQRAVALGKAECAGPYDVGMDGSGGIVLLYAQPNASDCNTVAAAVLGSDGRVIGSPQPVADNGGYFGREPRLAVDPSGNFVVAAGGGHPRAQRFASGGGKLGVNFTVGVGYTGTLTQFTEPDVASDADGNFVVVWDPYFVPDGRDIAARLYDGP